MILLNAILLNLYVRMMATNVEQFAFYKFFKFSLQYLFPVLRYPYDVILMMIRTMSTETYLHDKSISQSEIFLSISPACGWNAFTYGLTPVVLSVKFDGHDL